MIICMSTYVNFIDNSPTEADTVGPLTFYWFYGVFFMGSSPSPHIFCNEEKLLALRGRL